LNSPLFLSYWFVLFLAVLFPVYWFARSPLLRLWVLLVGCAVFHTHFAGPAGVIPIIVLATLTYLAGLTRKTWVCVPIIVLCVLALVFYKYTRFLGTEVLAYVWPHARDLVWHYQSRNWMMPPLAISFFVFEFVHYLVDVCRGGPAIKNPLGFALYSIFWPSIVAGPVKRYQDFMPALHQGIRTVNTQDVAVGVTRVGWGLFKKLIADTLTAFLTYWGPHFDSFDLLWRWGFVVGLGFRILLDFSGYSDMAIGFARMHGIRLMENFNWPYLATSITTFWHRWHISLSTWIRDYVYIALGGGRCGVLRKVGNGLLAFALCGLWHGAGWNFLVWGVYHGVGLAVSSNYRRALGGVGEAISRWLGENTPVAWGATMLYVMVGWVFFFYPLSDACHMVGLLFGITIC
jgi:alginate O-acetyltransferase complex protein AlgI